MESFGTHRDHSGNSIQAGGLQHCEDEDMAWPQDEVDGMGNARGAIRVPALGTDGGDNHGNGEQEVGTDPVTRCQAWCLYGSHALSMWNSRTYEFAAILFIQTAFPGNLMASSIKCVDISSRNHFIPILSIIFPYDPSRLIARLSGIAETICVLVFQSALGRWLDAHPSRLNALLPTIHINRLAVIVCCAIWALVLGLDAHPSLQIALFGLVLLLGMCEKLARMTNTLAVERDWVPTMADCHSSLPSGRSLAGFAAAFACWPLAESSSTPPYDLTHLNTVMRRIDMLCKLVAPLALSTFIATIAPVSMAVWIVASSNAACWAFEVWGIRAVWLTNARLRAPKASEQANLSSTSLELTASPRSRLSVVVVIFRKLKASLKEHVVALRYFFSTPVWVPALVVALMHASVLSYSATLLVYLLNAGFPLGTITVARAGGAVFEIASTFVFPWAVSAAMMMGEDGGVAGKHDAGGFVPVRRFKDDEEEEDEDEGDEAEAPEDQLKDASAGRMIAAVVRVGLLGVCGLVVALIPVLYAVFAIPSSPPSPASSPPPSPPSPVQTHPLATTVLFIALSASFLGRWLFDLAATQLAQLLVPAARRAGLGGTEMALVGAVSMAHWISATIWHRQADFRWLALASVVGVGAGGVGYAVWALKWMRGKGGQVTRRSW